MAYLIGLDIGTTSTKALALRPNGQVGPIERAGYETYAPYPGYSEQDPDAVVEAALEAVGALRARLGSEPVLGLCLSCAMHGLLAVDAGGRPLTSLITWADTRSQPQADALRAQDDQAEIYRHTGTPIHPMAPLSKMVWLREHEPAVMERAARFISAKEYFVHRLFGDYLIDHGLASATGLFNLARRDWHRPALDAAGIGPECLSTPVSVSQVLRVMEAGCAKRMGLPRDTAVVMGSSDGALANLGTGVMGPGRAAVSIGTSGALRVATARLPTDEKRQLFRYILDDRLYLIGGAINNGGLMLSWFSDAFYGDHDEPLRIERLLEDVAQTAPGSEGLLCLPYLQGERAPHWDAQARGAFLGVAQRHGRPHFARAALEGVVLALLSIGKALVVETEPIEALHATGGFTRSAGWVQMLSDVFDLPVHVPSGSEGSALGAALMGLTALGHLDGPDDAASLIEFTEVYRPAKDASSVYKTLFPIFNGLYTHLKEDFARLTAYQTAHATDGSTSSA